MADDLIGVFASTHHVKIVTDYAGSEVLLAKMRLVHKGDLYLPGDRYYVDQAVQAGMILSQTPVCYFVPMILVQKGNPKNVQSLRDLTRPGLKIGLGDPQACAIGRETRQLLDKNGIAWPDIEKNVAFQSLTVNELGLQIQAKALDAVIVWDAIAQYYQDSGTEIADSRADEHGFHGGSRRPELYPEALARRAVRRIRRLGARPGHLQEASLHRHPTPLTVGHTAGKEVTTDELKPQPTCCQPTRPALRRRDVLLCLGLCRVRGGLDSRRHLLHRSQSRGGGPDVRLHSPRLVDEHLDQRDDHRDRGALCDPHGLRL